MIKFSRPTDIIRTWASQAKITWYAAVKASSTVRPATTSPWLRKNITFVQK